MAVSDSAKVDLLYKKYFGATKTDLPANKSPSNEAIASPLLVRGDTIWQEATSIPPTAAATAGIVQAYQGTGRIQCVADNTTVPISSVYPSWKTNLTDWIPSEFGSTYFIKIYVDNAAASDPSATGTQIFDSGSGGTGEWNFDYSSGVLNFIGGTIPAVLTSSKVIYVMGYRYIGLKGITTFGSLTAGNITVTGNITATYHLGNVYADTISSNVTSSTVFTGTAGIGLPVGNNTNRPDGFTGQTRFNTDLSVIEFFNGTEWIPVTNSITDQQIEPDGESQSYELNKNATSAGVIVSINGTVQTPGLAYTCSGTTITFAEIPQTSDYIDIRFIATAVTTNDEYETITTGAVTVGTSTAIVDSFPSATFRSAKYTISSTNSDAQFYEVMLTQYDGDVAIATTSNVRTGTEFITFSANVNGSTVNLLAQGSISSNSLRIKRVYFNV